MRVQPRQRYFRMMRTKKPVGFRLKPKGGPHIDPQIEAMLEKYRKDGQISRAEAVYFAETPEFSSLGISYDEGFIHVVETPGEPQRRDQAWLRELQLRHHKNRELVRRLPPQTKAARKEFKDMSDQTLCESYFSGVEFQETDYRVGGD